MGVIDLSFDILMGLNENTIDWVHLEGFAVGLWTVGNSMRGNL